jgi:glycosyltransferase involved in cell wall biosynthesis
VNAHSLRIALIASDRYPIREPFAGGLEAQTWALADGLRRRGHEISLFAAPGSDPELTARVIDVARPRISPAAMQDMSMPPEEWLGEHHAYLALMIHLMTDGAGRYDVVHNNSLHHLPVAMARAISVPLVTTLHTPPTPWLESAITTGPCPATFVAVSAGTAGAWRHVVPDVQIVMNGVDLERWHPGAGGGPLVWSGRLVPEKGPDLAVAAAKRAGLPLVLAGPATDKEFFAERIEPHLDDDISYAGHLSHDRLVELIGSARASLVTPRWDEPYGLVAAESLACGTPVVGFDRGGISEVVDDQCAILVPADDVEELARAACHFASLDRHAARRRAEQHCSVARMLDEYESIYTRVRDSRAA